MALHNIEHWSGEGSIAVAESKSGVLVTINPHDNLVTTGVAPWPTPEILQKLYASDRFKGKTPEDDAAARETLGHFSNLQSLNSEDAVTWSVIGPVMYGPPALKQHFADRLLTRLDLPTSSSVALWLWRRIPHPEKPASIGGPEIDFGLLTDRCAVFGEAKWNSGLGRGQGVKGDRSQLDLRAAYCARMGTKTIPGIQHWAVLGVGRSADVFSASGQLPIGCEAVGRHNLTWQEIVNCLPTELTTEVRQYLHWKELHSSKKA
jgi:hypothetical protein